MDNDLQVNLTECIDTHHTQMPKGWVCESLGNIARVRRGASPRPISSPIWFSTTGPGWVRISDVTSSNTFLLKTEQKLSPRGASKSVPVFPGQVIMSICGTVAEPIIVGIQACIHDGFVVFDKHEASLCEKFLVHKLRNLQSYFLGLGQPGTQVNLNSNIVKSAPIPLPPLPEQRQIAEVLDTVDEAIRKTEQIIEKLKKVKDGLLHDLLTRGVGENGNLRDPERNPELFKDSPLGQIPKEWDVGTLLEYVPKTEYGISISLSSRGAIPVLRMMNFEDGEAALSELKFCNLKDVEGLLLAPGDVLFNRTNSIEHVGRTGIWRDQLPVVSFASYLVRLVPAENRMSSEFLNRWLNWELTQVRIRKWATPGVHQVNINPTNLRKTLIAVPKKIAEQERITNILRKHDSKSSALQEELHKLRSLKQGLMEDLLSGKVSTKDMRAVA